MKCWSEEDEERCYRRKALWQGALAFGLMVFFVASVMWGSL